MSSSSACSFSDVQMLSCLSVNEREVEDQMRWALKHYFRVGVQFNLEDMRSFVVAHGGDAGYSVEYILGLYVKYGLITAVLKSIPKKYMITAAGVKYANEYVMTDPKKAESLSSARPSSPPGGAEIKPEKKEKKASSDKEDGSVFSIKVEGDKFYFVFDRKYLAKLLRKSKEDGVVVKF